VAYLQDYAAGMRLRLGTRVHRVDRVDAGWELRLDGESIRAGQVVIATGPDAVPVMPAWPGMAGFPGTVIHAGQFRNVAEMAALDVLVVGPGNSGVDLLGHLARSDAGQLWLSARSGMNITPLRLGGAPLHPVSVLGRHLPLRWQDANARAVQRLAFGDLSRFGYPPPSTGSTARRPVSPMAPAAHRMRSSARPATGPDWSRSSGTWSRWTAWACRRSPAPAHHRPTPACGSSAWTAASTATCTSGVARHASWPRRSDGNRRRE
jgi:cation diffusion facilitator CzcD-associated flavoprotein CzcO